MIDFEQKSFKEIKKIMQSQENYQELNLDHLKKIYELEKNLDLEVQKHNIELLEA